jgi:hypothetical protein
VLFALKLSIDMSDIDYLREALRMFEHVLSEESVGSDLGLPFSFLDDPVDDFLVLSL